MSIDVKNADYCRVIFAKSRFPKLQRYVLYQFHPRSLFIDSVGLIWFVYWLWHHDWVLALCTLVAARLIAYLSVANINLNLFAETILGRIARLHLNPFNFVNQVIGSVVLLISIWQHSIEGILIGFSIILIGHICGWTSVHKKFRNQYPGEEEQI